MFARSLPWSRAAGADAVEQMLVRVPARRAVWEQLSVEDKEIVSVWLGLSWWPATRRDRRRRAESGLDLGVETLHTMLHERGDVGGAWSASMPGR